MNKIDDTLIEMIRPAVNGSERDRAALVNGVKAFALISVAADKMTGGHDSEALPFLREAFNYLDPNDTEDAEVRQDLENAIRLTEERAARKDL